ncbi:hypothetical protein NHP190002_13160 [Helicobacter ailurogastricus]|uniref:hypothetical protein n=1 Tax=Helicobacter ailurogastricus TaxID=1578720 RepID=UPI00244D7ED4|nr:hypothetical protein [Helicobacter ailurogastricus]GMB90611.1 hypothetical protein NHP190002_13160 [Helicobacter ailurogastricus]
MPPIIFNPTPLASLLPTFTPEQAHAFSAILGRFLEAEAKGGEEGIEKQLAQELPGCDAKEIRAEIEAELKIYEQKQESLEKALENGRTKEQWLASEFHKASQNLATQEVLPYLNNLDNALKEANYKIQEALLTNEGLISQNPNLDGFIAEQQHANSFNLKATARGSQYRVEVLKPEGQYSKNGVDIVMKNGEGKIIQRHQSKYGQDAPSTQKAFEKGDYRGQQKLVPSDQKAQLQEQGLKVTDKLEAPDGTTSTPLSKQEVKELQSKAQQEGKLPQADYNDYKIRDLALGIGKEAGKVGLISAGISLAIDGVALMCSKEKLDKSKAQEMAKRAITTGADTTAKTAAAAAIKVAAEKGILPKVCGAKNVFVALGTLAIDHAKVLYKLGKGDITGEQAIEQLHINSLSTIAGIVGAAAGESMLVAALTSLGVAFGPVGMAVAGFVAGTLGYMAGSSVGQKIASSSKSFATSVANSLKSACQAVGNAIKSVASSVASGVKSVCQTVAGWFS